MPGFLLLFIKKEELFLRIGPLSLDTLIYAHIPTIWHPKKKKKKKKKALFGPLEKNLDTKLDSSGIILNEEMRSTNCGLQQQCS